MDYLTFAALNKFKKMGEVTKPTFNTQVIKDLQSEQPTLVKKALTKIKDKGNEKHIVPLVNLYETSSDDSVKNEIKDILSQLKNTKAIVELMPFLEKENNRIKELILHSLWSSGFDLTDHIPIIIETSCEGDFMVLLESLTLIENLEGPFIEDDLILAISTLNEKINDCEDESILNLLNSLLSVIQHFESQIEI